VAWAEVREHTVRRTVELPGTVEARTSSLVASEVDGLVDGLRAREGQAVGKGQVLVHLRTADLELRLQAAEAGRREAQARLEQADADLERNQDLFDQGILSASQFGASRSERDAWQGRADQLSAEIARLKLDLERSSVQAPFAGVVVAERCEVGEWVGRGDPVVELASLQDLEVRVDVPERYFSQLERGAEATVRFEALAGREVTGTVEAIIPQANPQARTFPLKVRITNPEGRIGAGMLARVALPAGEAYPALVVPKDAVVTRGRDRLVFRLKDDDTVEMVAVQTGAGVGSWVEVREGLARGARVVTRGNERLQPGQAVVGEAGEHPLP
jgi:RND family efflux transporter MFP subunit